MLKDILSNHVHPLLQKDIRDNWNSVLVDGKSAGAWMRDVDRFVGGATGLVVGASIGNSIGDKLTKRKDSIARRLLKRTLGTVIGGSVGAVAGVPLGEALGETDVVNDLYRKLGVLTQNYHVGTRDAIGRVYQYMNTINSSTKLKDNKLLNILSLLNDYRDNDEITGQILEGMGIKPN